MGFDPIAVLKQNYGQVLEVIADDNEYSMIHRIGLWENLQESPIFDGKNHGFL